LEEKNPQQTKLLDSVKYLIEQRLALMKKNIGLYEAAGRQSTGEIDGNRRRGQAILDSIRLFSERFINAEEASMIERKRDLSGSFNTTNIITIISLLTSIF